MENLLLELVRLGQLHCVRLKQISVQHEDKKTTAAVYAYQVDNSGEWVEIQFDLEKGTAWVETFAENDPCDTLGRDFSRFPSAVFCVEQKSAENTFAEGSYCRIKCLKIIQK